MTLLLAGPIAGADERDGGGDRKADRPGAPSPGPAPEASEPEGDPPPAGVRRKEAKAEPGKVRWLALDKALESCRRDYLPVVVVLAAGREGRDESREPEDVFVKEMRAALADPETAKVLRAFLCVEVAPAGLEAPYPVRAPAKPPAEGKGAKAGKGGRGKAADGGGKEPAGQTEEGPPAEGAKAGDGPAAEGRGGGAGGVALADTVAGRLKVARDVPVLLVLDFREKVVRRYAERFPRREVLRRQLKTIAQETARLAALARKVEAVLEKAEYSYALGETRQGVQAVLSFEDAKFQRTLDAVLAERLGGLFGRWRKDASSAMAAGEALEKGKKYLDAVKAYQDAARRFPFPEILKESARKQGTAMRRARGDL